MEYLGLFVSDIPKKHRFTLQDAIVGKPSIGTISLDLKPLSEPEKTKSTNSLVDGQKQRKKPQKTLDDNLQSDQFLSPNIFSFLHNVKLPSLPLLDNMIIKRPQGPPPPPHPPSASFSPVPQTHPPPTNPVPNLESQHNSEALDFFNAGLDNFIQNPATLTQIPRPANSQRSFQIDA